VMRSWGKAYVKWGLALDQNRGPHAGGLRDMHTAGYCQHFGCGFLHYRLLHTRSFQQICTARRPTHLFR